MDAFESLVAEILQSKGYWTMTSFKVELTKEEKIEIGRPNTPRWEIDILAYSGKTNELLVVECKSFLDSGGVQFSSFKGEHYAEKYKLFNDDKLREVIFRRLTSQLLENGHLGIKPNIRLCLVAGNIYHKEKDKTKLIELFKQKGWELFDDEWLREGLNSFSNTSYTNNISTIVSKLLIRNKEE